MTDFATFLRAAGLQPRAIVPDGRWRRCPTDDHPRKKNGAYCLAADGRIGWCQDWAVHSEPLTWRPDGATEAAKRDAPDYQAIRRRNELEEAKRQRATDAAAAYYRACSALSGGHPYLAAHGLDMTGCRGLRVDRDGWLVVPMGRAGKLWSVQRIAPDGQKRFWFGAPVIGASYTVERSGATLTVLCEGLATGLAIYAAVPLSRVVVAFTAANLPKVAARLERRGMACVAADNDHRTVCQPHKKDGLDVPMDPRAPRPDWCRCNPGVTEGLNAAAILGCGAAEPDGIAGTDWSDWRRETLAARVGREVYGKRKESESSARRAVDAALAREMMRAARYLRATG